MDSSLGLTHFGAMAVVVYAMNLLKNASWFPLVQKDRVVLNRVFGAIVSFIVSIGIHYTFMDATGGGHQLIVDIPTFSVLAHGLWDWIVQYAGQETIFHATKGGALADILKVVQQLAAQSKPTP